jgi:hypothetical protein
MKLAGRVVYLSSVCRALVAVASWTDERIPVPFDMHVASIPPNTLRPTPMAITHSRVSRLIGLFTVHSASHCSHADGDDPAIIATI